MPTFFANKSIIPSPFVSFNRSYIKTGDQVTIGKTYDITINGKLLAYKGSPTSSGTWWDQSGYPPDESIGADSRLSSIENKQQALRALFNKTNEGQTLEFQVWDGGPSIKCNPRILDIQFQEGLWVEVCDYTITLQADKLYGSPTIAPNDEDTFTQYLQDASESWSIDFAEQPENDIQQQTFRVNHQISAVGKTTYDATGASLGDAWTQAQSWVLGKLGLDLTVVFGSGVLNVPSYFAGFNHVRTENIDKNAGSFSVNESWILASGSAIEDYTVTVTSGINDGLIKVGINGSIQGMEIRDSNYGITQTKYQSANTKFGQIIGQLQSRAQTYSNVTLNSIPIESVVGKNPVAGNINYSYEYNDRVSNYITGAKSELITITEAGGGDVVASIGILGRAIGPILQPINTIQSTQRNVSIEAVMPAVKTNNYTDWINAKPNISGLLALVRPTTSQVFTVDKNENWNPKTGHYSYSISYLYQ